jgi:predicted aspartyl protease
VPIGVEGAAGSVTVTVRITVAGRGPYLFALDTGASSTVIDKALASRIGLRTLGPAGRVTGVTGSERATAFLVPSWSLGNVPLPANHRVLGLSLRAGELNDGLGLSGLLGSDLLSRYGSISVDYANSQLHLGGRC